MAQILYLTRIELAFGAARLLPAECERIGMRRPLVITDAGVRAAGVLDEGHQAGRGGEGDELSGVAEDRARGAWGCVARA